MTEPLNPVNPFDPSATEAAIFKTLDDATAAIPDGHTHAVLLDATDTAADGPAGTVVFVEKLPSGWNVVAQGGYSEAHGFGGSVLLGKSW